MTLTWRVPIGEFALTSRPGRLTTMAASRCRAGRVQPHHAGRCRLRCAHASPGRWRRPSGEDGGPGVVWTASGNRSRSRSEAGGGTGRTRRRRRLRRSLIRGTIANRGSSTTRVPAAGSASGMRQEMHRNFTDAAGSSVQTGTMVRQETAGQGMFRPIPAQGGCGPDCLRIRRLGVQIPPGALC